MLNKQLLINMKKEQDMLEPKENVNLTKNYNKKILLEKRKRFQVYNALEHLLSFNTYFDYFSSDAFNIVKYSHILAQCYQANLVTSEYLLYPFFEIDSELPKILNDFGLTKQIALNFITLKKRNSVFSLKEKLLQHFKLPFLVEKLNRNTFAEFSGEVNQIFEKAAENARNRFKTPVITSEILLLTLMEQNKSTIGKYIAKAIPNRINWYLLRYKLLKRIHSSELSIRTQVSINQQHFAYLLKIQIPDVQFNRLIENEIISLGVLFFRNKLLTKVREISLESCLENEIFRSIKVTGTRKYTS
jgi:hypothetical protein